MSKGGNASEPIGVLDFETDPFLIGRIPHPFAVCIYFARDDYVILWEPNIIPRLLRALRRLRPCTLYAHNGGKFDFHYLIEHAEPQELKVHNGRIAEMRIGKVTLKDSFPLMPFPLAEYQKTKINYEIFEKSRRNTPRNKERIQNYLLDDCIYLHELLISFREVVGNKDTIGSAAFSLMREMGIKIPSLPERHDETFRPYYFGGRVEAFKKGIFNGRYVYLDINSAYPYAMLHAHPSGADYLLGARLPSVRTLGPQFIRCTATSKGALPMRGDDGSLCFPHGRFEFNATGWEIAAGIRTNTLRIERISEVWQPRGLVNFRDYINTYFAKRDHAKRQGDEAKRLAYKYLLNSGYGKFAQNPRDFKTYCLAPYGRSVPGCDWETDFGAVSLWSKSAYNGHGFFDVATAASITGFVRAFLWQAICKARNVLYADTDSLICQSAQLAYGDKLGQWKREHSEGVYVKRAAIAGKKLYGLEWSKPDKAGKMHRIASKGARLNWREMLDVCRGKSIMWENSAPTFTLGNPHFIRRRIRST